MAKYYINFNAMTPGAFFESGWKWGQANGGYGASITDTGAGTLVNMSSSSAGTKILSPNILDGINDIEGLALFRTSSNVGKQGILSLRYGGTTEANTTGYTLSGSLIGGVRSLAIDEGATGYIAWVPWDYQPGTNYWVRFRVIGNTMKAKVWLQAEQEPVAWAMEQTNSVRSTGSYSGMHQYATGSVTYEKLSFASNGDTAPASQAEVDRYNADIINAAAPTSTPIVGYSGGYGGIFTGFGSALGLAKQNTSLVANDTLHTNTVTNISVTQVHNVVADNTSHGHAASSVSVTQLHILGINNTSHALTSTSPVFAITHNLAVDNTSHSLTSENIALITGYAAVAANALHSLTSDNIAISQTQTIAIDNSLHENVSTSTSLIEAKTLAIANALHSLADNIGPFSITHILGVANTTHAHSTTSVALLQSALLVLSQATHAVTSTSVDIIQFTLLGKPDDTVHGTDSSPITLTSKQVLEIQDALHLIKSLAIVNIIDWTEMNVDFGRYQQGWTTGGNLEQATASTGRYTPQVDTEGILIPVTVEEGRFTQNTIQKGNF